MASPNPEHSSERKAPSAKVVHAAICAEGEEELARPSSALAWSGLAAGLSLGFSFLFTGALQAALPAAPWTHLITAFGYPVGFLIVILGRQQLFTENTLTVILPMFQRRDVRTLGNVLRLWGVVLAANVVGALVFAAALAYLPVVDAPVVEALRTAAAAAEPSSFGHALVRGVVAGWLIALVVWLLPFAGSARISVIAVLTYIVGVAHLPHVVVGTTEIAFRVFVGDTSWATFATHLFLPALIGNILGGVALVAFLNHAQVVSSEK